MTLYLKNLTLLVKLVTIKEIDISIIYIKYISFIVKGKKIEKSRKIHKRTGKTFYFATKLFPKNIREETYVLYGFFRKSDDVVDTLNPTENQYEKLNSFKNQAIGVEEPESPVMEAFSEVREYKNISDKNIESFIDSMKMDIEKNDYRTYEELESYMDGSAAAVGRMMTEIIEPDEIQKALEHATSLGIAFQMTNFIRDVGEDIDLYNRVYLPRTTREKYNITRSDIKNKNLNNNFKKLLEEEMQRTEDIYEYGVRGIKYLPEDTQFPIFLSAVLYSDYHRMIRKENYDVLNDKHDISRMRKINLLFRSYWKWRRCESPFEAFKKTSTIYDRNHGGIASEINNK